MTDTFPIKVPDEVRARQRVLDERLRPKKAKSRYDPVVVICYNTLEKWESRREAYDFYVEGMLACEGSEGERYTNVVVGLSEGKTIVTDGVYE